MITSRVGQLVTRGDVVCDHDEEAANTAVVITKAAVAGLRYCLHGVQWSYSAAPTGGRLIIQSAAVVIFEVDIIAGGPGGFNIYLEAVENEDLVVTLAAGSGTVVGNLNIQTLLMPA